MLESGLSPPEQNLPDDRQSADDLRRQAAVLRFCEEVLRERAEESTRPWLWQIKGKVAAYCRRSLERKVPEDHPPSPVLSEAQERQILRTHPLLRDEPTCESPRDPCPDWLTELRGRVWDVLRKLRDNQSQ